MKIVYGRLFKLSVGDGVREKERERERVEKSYVVAAVAKKE